MISYYYLIVLWQAKRVYVRGKVSNPTEFFFKKQDRLVKKYLTYKEIFEEDDNFQFN